MNKFTFLSCLVLLISVNSCYNSDNDKSHNVVVKYIKENLGEPDSYLSISWDSVAPTFLKKIDSRQYLDLQDSISYLAGYMTESFRSNNGRFNAELYDSVIRIINTLKIEQSKYQFGVDSSITVGYSIRHRYKAKNKHGALEVIESDFKLNLKMDTVITYN